ncbi:response regulator [Natrinema halophilum]|uniref:Response regulator n=1 Tax=Natrinema halophilum TaxID=1699371 RepID=A0A7D5GFH9_9EURY|nr:response regulator [Natrinema halophilum]QLG47627.1 response regulator [Natrinema halophilum]
MSDGRDDPIDVLLIEDDSEDARRIRDSFADLELEISVHVVADGSKAVSLLTDRVDDPTAMPDLIVLNLNLARMSGLEFLDTIEDEPVIRRLPILVLTRSATGEDVRKCYELPANAYITKPTDPLEYANLVEAIADFWFRHVALPTSAL